MTASSVLIDTNVLVYSVDISEPGKLRVAEDVLDHLATSRMGAVTPQVIAEFVPVISTKLRAPLLAGEPDQAARSALEAFELIPVNSAVVRQALRCWRRYSISYWDAQIWATARIGGIDTIVSEDCPMPELEGIRYVNPFAEGFSLEDLGVAG